VNAADASTGLKGIDVLISTSGFEGLGLQSTLAKAALEAGVKLFVPTEFGDTTDGRPEPLMALKASIRDGIAATGLPTVAFFSGLWTEWVLNLGFDLKNGKIEIKGQGDAEISTTSIDDVARFVAYVLTELPKDKLENAKFSLQGDKIVSGSFVLASSMTYSTWLTHMIDVQLPRCQTGGGIGQKVRHLSRPALGS
jgi:hypothetical protein